MSGLGVVAAGVAGTGVGGLVAKATLVLCLALALAWFARRGSARTLHLLWTTAFVLLLALPVLSLLGPSWTVPILPARDVETRGESFVMAVEEASARATARETPGSPMPAGSPRRMEGSMTSSGSGTEASSPSQPGAGDVRAPLTPAGLAFLIWALGCGAALISLGVGSLRFRKLVREAAPVRDPAWRRQADAIRRRLRVRTQVRILMSPKVPTPMAGGPWRPVILLPSVAEAWSPERRAVVLAHELIHVRRRDTLRQVVGRCVVALYWFHPLSWPACRAATIAAERSCDEEVLELGTRPSEYARHLLSLASGTTGRRAVLALPMVQRSQLENRIMSILKRQRPRYSLARTIAALVGIGVSGMLIACANPVPRDRATEPSPPAMDEVPAVPEPVPATSATTDATPGGPGNVEPAADRIGTPEAIDLQALDCTLWSVSMTLRDVELTTVQTTVDGMQLCMRSRGDVVMTESGTAIESMDATSWLVLQSRAEKLHRMVITSGPDGIEYDWSIDGRSQPFDVEAREWRDLMLIVLARSGEATQIRGREASLRGQIASHRGWVATLQGRIASHRSHVATLQSQIASFRADVAGLHAQMASVRARAYRFQGPLGAVWQTRERVHINRVNRQRATRSPVPDSIGGPPDSIGAIDAATGALETAGMREALADLSEALQAVVGTLEEDLRRAERDLNATRAELAAKPEVSDLDASLQELRQAIDNYQLDRRIAEIEAQIESYDLDGKVRGIEAQIEEYDLDGKIREIEAQIEGLDADRRADEIERSVQDDIAALRRLIG